MHAIANDWRNAKLTEPDRALCKFAVKVTREQHRLTRDDVELLRKSGFSDRAIHDAVQVIGYFNYITRIADSLGVEEETFIPRWGRGQHQD